MQCTYDIDVIQIKAENKTELKRRFNGHDEM
jgi:hypothetical protein